MGIIPIRALGDPVLRARAAEVDTFDATLCRLMDDMFETMYDAPGVGLAAPQVGGSLRFFVYDDGQDTKGAVANPRLVHVEGGQVEEGGGRSIPGPYYETHRPMSLRFQGQDLD